MKIFAMVVLVFFAASLALDSKRHISIHLFVRKLSRYNQLRLELLFQSFVLAFLVLLIIYGSILLSCFAFTVAIGMPVAFSLGITGVTFFLISEDLSMLAVPTLIFGGISPFALMAITAFILTGLLVEKSGVVQDLVDFSDSIPGFNLWYDFNYSPFPAIYLVAP